MLQKKIEQQLKSAIAELKNSDDPKKISIFKKQLEILSSLEKESTVPIEGIVFKYGDKMYKLVGKFSPINKILGLLRYVD